MWPCAAIPPTQSRWPIKSWGPSWKALQREFMCNHRNAFGLCFWAQKKPMHIAKYLASTTFQAWGLRPELPTNRILYLATFRSWTDVNRPDWPPGSYNCCLLDKRWPRCCGASERAGDGNVLADCSLEWLWTYTMRHQILVRTDLQGALLRICADAEPKRIETYKTIKNPWSVP